VFRYIPRSRFHRYILLLLSLYLWRYTSIATGFRSTGDGSETLSRGSGRCSPTIATINTAVVVVIIIIFAPLPMFVFGWLTDVYNMRRDEVWPDDGNANIVYGEYLFLYIIYNIHIIHRFRSWYYGRAVFRIFTQPLNIKNIEFLGGFYFLFLIFNFNVNN